MGQLLRYKLSVPHQEPGQRDDSRHMATTFIDAVRETLKGGGFAEIDKSVEKGGNFIVGYRGRIYVIYDDFQVEEPSCGYAAVGCGSDYAMGAMFSRVLDTPQDRLDLALSAAAEFSVGVRPPFAFLSMPRA
jgi:ATP-dependent protease HslVU (ClpYQ) peptidase subunit